jgi:hypothetical protein
MHLLCCQVLISKRFIELFQTGFSSIITDQCFLTTYNQYIWSYSIPSISCTNLKKTLQGAETLDCNFFCGIMMRECASAKFSLQCCWIHLIYLFCPQKHSLFSLLTFVHHCHCKISTVYFFVSPNNRWWINQHHICHTMTLVRHLYLDILVPLLRPLY